ncbi:hypothetical protein ACLMJK_001742 [Lecanora helva]
MSASSRVLLLPELLECILQLIPPLDVLLQQRTCRTWQAVIQQSSLLQQKLFFKAPDPVPYPDTELWRELWNPLLFTLPLWTSISADYLEIELERVKLLKNDRQEASWRRMFIAKRMTPPVYIFFYTGPVEKPSAKDYRLRACEDDPGDCGMDQLEDYLCSLMSEPEAAKIPTRILMMKDRVPRLTILT